MSVLITGANGHVGFLAVKQAVAAGLSVVAQVRSLGRVPSEASALKEGQVTWVACELSDPSQISALGNEYEIEGCIHLAAVPNDELARPDPWAAIQSNVTATAALLELARLQKWRRFIYVSTGSVFQNNSDFSSPIAEDRLPCPKTTYGSTKHAGELMVQLYKNDFDVSAATVRISHVYGPPLVPRARNYPRGPLVAFLREAVLGEEINDSSGGDYESSFTHVLDVANGLLAAYTAETLNYSVYHLGNSRNWSGNDVVAAIRKVLPEAQINLGAGTKPWSDYTALRGPLLDTRLKDDAGFTPQFPLEEGVADFAEWMQKNRDMLL
ncbi:NAD(P)-dependent oxidoreductase [Lentibacter algarum]|uniref:NAD-dependent epimerase/dehydratase family protein n=1 Tax=Lentibacter algarum TaxID=576131 RepID=UPI001C071828|nr:NAD(P)-dependent oxidoreductase [Lentibacter algarum]MBU2980186.1 NAD(P)-dependent oxidoreductase [Lentibacter algarum]